MIIASLLNYLAQSADAPPPSVGAWLSILTGSGGALATLGFWVKTLIAEKREMIEAHKTKDEALLKITRESIACISESVSLRKLDESFRTRLEDLLQEIRERLPD